MAKALNKPTANKSLRSISVIFRWFLNSRIIMGASVIVVNECTETAQNRGYEFRTPILSILEVILKIKAAININLGPCCSNIALKGARYPVFFLLMFKTYDPITMKITPITPRSVGNCPRIKGDTIKRKSGVKANNGIVRDKSDVLIALSCNIVAITFNAPSISNAIQY